MEWLQGIKTGLSAYGWLYPQWLRNKVWYKQALIIGILLSTLLILGFVAFQTMSQLIVAQILEHKGKVITIGVIGIAIPALWKLGLIEKVWDTTINTILYPFRKTRNILWGTWVRKIFLGIPVIAVLGFIIWFLRGLYQDPASEITAHLANIVVLVNIASFFFFIIIKRKSLVIINVVAFIFFQYIGIVDIMSSNARISHLVVNDIYTLPQSHNPHFLTPDIVDGVTKKSYVNDINEEGTQSDLILNQSSKKPEFTLGVVNREWLTKFGEGQSVAIATVENLSYISKNSVTQNPSKQSRKDAVIKGTTKKLKEANKNILFQTEKGLVFGRDVYTAVRKKLPLKDFFVTKVQNTYRIPHDSTVTIAILIDKLTNFPNAYYVPYGIYVIHADEEYSFSELALFGAGEFIPLNEINKHSYLKGQINFSQNSIKEIGNSAKYRKGYIDAFWRQTESLKIDVANGKQVINYNIIDKGYQANLPMVGTKNETNLSETWFIPFDSDGNTVNAYIHGGDSPAVSTIGNSALGSFERSFDPDKFDSVGVHPDYTSINGEIYTTHIGAVVKKDPRTGEYNDLKPKVYITDGDQYTMYDREIPYIDQVKKLHRIK